MLRWIVPALLLAGAGAGRAEPVAPQTSGASVQAPPAGADFDRLFGAEPDRPDAGAAGAPGRDSLSIVALALGRTVLNPALPAFDTPGGLCLHATDLFDSLEIAHASDGADILVTLTQPGRTVRIPAADLQQTPAGRCLTLDALAHALPARFRHDRENLRVLVEPGEPLPVSRRLEREERRAHLAKPLPATPDFPRVENPWRAVSAPTLDIAAGFSVRQGQSSTRLALEASGDLAGLSARVRSGLEADGGTSLRTTFSRSSDTPDLLGPIGARGVQFGDISAPAQPLLAETAAGRGLVVTSRPAWAADLFDRIDLTGPLPPGWDAELHRDDRLLAVATQPDADGNFRFPDVPLRVGANRYVVKLFGPRGEQEERVFVRVIGRELNPENELHYTVGAVQPGVPLVGPRAGSSASPTAFATVERGLTGTLSARVDLRVSGAARAASAGLHAAILGGSASLVAGTGSGGQPPVALRAARRIGGADFGVTLADYGSRAAPEAPADMQEIRRLAMLEANFRLPLGRRSAQVQLGLREALERSGAQITRLESSAGLAIGAARLSNRLGAEWRRTARGTDTRADGSLGASIGLADWRLRASADYRLAPGLAVERLVASAGHSSSRRSLQTELGWDLASRQPLAGLSATRYIGPLSLKADAGTTGAAWRAGLSLGVSLYRPVTTAEGYRLGPPGFSRSGALRPHVFIDHDDDGLQGPGDEPVPDARFLVDNSLRPETTDSQGKGLISGLSAGRPIAVELQLASLPGLGLRPRLPGQSAQLRPGQVLDLPVPLGPTGEIEIRLLARAGTLEKPLSGAIVRLTDAAGKATDLLSDFDGYVYADGLAFGPYRASAPGRPGAEPLDIRLDRTHPSALGRRLLVDPAPAVSAGG